MTQLLVAPESGRVARLPGLRRQRQRAARVEQPGAARAIGDHRRAALTGPSGAEVDRVGAREEIVARGVVRPARCGVAARDELFGERGAARFVEVVAPSSRPARHGGTRAERGAIRVALLRAERPVGEETGGQGAWRTDGIVTAIGAEQRESQEESGAEA